MIRVGIDAGGTFTDCVAFDQGRLRMCKLCSRPDDPAAVVEEALRKLAPGAEVVELVFSTSVSTNALLERSGGPTVLITTAGFEDVLEIGRQPRPTLHALHPELPPPLVTSSNRLGAAERIRVDGSVVRALEPAELERLTNELEARPAAKIAISLLYAQVNPTHEQQLAAHLRGRGYAVSISSEICPLPREYERTATTAADAYVAGPLGEALSGLRREGLILRVMESSGGARRAGAARPVRTVGAGASAGLIAVERTLYEQGLGAALALDIGGTSTDVAWVGPTGPRRVDEVSVAGVTIALPNLAVESVGAGGGSIAWIDGGGALRIGPRSAGARPGPAAYGRGGEEPTLTDAHVVLGRLGARLADGAVMLHVENARRALGTLAVPLGASVEATAEAIVSVANVAIARALRGALAGDHAEAIVTYGGASGLHVVEVARELGIPRVIVPVAPGLQSALGALDAPVIVEAFASWMEPLCDRPSAALRERVDVLVAQVRAELAHEPQARGDAFELFEISARVRGAGHSFDAELELPLEGLSRAAFMAAHEIARGQPFPAGSPPTSNRAAIVITRLTVRGRRTPHGPRPSATMREIGWPRVGSRSLFVGGTRQRTPVYRRDRLRAGVEVIGPAIVEELSATLYLPSGARAVRSRECGALEVSA